MELPSKCPQCGSGDLIPNVYVKALTTSGSMGVVVEVAARPDARLFKGRQQGLITATVCGGCGLLVRLYAQNAQELLAAHHHGQAKA